MASVFFNNCVSTVITTKLFSLSWCVVFSRKVCIGVSFEKVPAHKVIQVARVITIRIKVATLGQTSLPYAAIGFKIFCGAVGTYLWRKIARA